MSRQRRLPRTWRDTLIAVLVVTVGLLLTSGAVVSVVIGDLVLTALTVAIGVTTFFTRRTAALDAELTDRTFDLAHVQRELAACEAELDEACDELARRGRDGGVTDE